MVARTHKVMYITDKFPMSAQNGMKLFRIISLPLPINHTSTHATQLLDLPEFLAISSTNSHYSLLNHGDFLSCSSLTIQCPNGNKTHEGCSLWLLNVSYRCSVSSKSHYLPPRLQSCTVALSDTPVTTSYPVNLALLRNFFSEALTSDIFGNTTFPSPISVEVPPFKIFKSNFSSFLVQDRQSDLSFRKMAESAKRREVIFQNLAEPVIDGQIAISVFLYKKFGNQVNATHLVMELTNGIQSIMIKIVQLPVCAGNLQILYPTEIHDIDITGRFFPKLGY
ncbi:uncharacterized protein LOC135498682 [Lineus longissimus]|uniref:uncharacterized protein LOC135498682 n=1 Tax=Lineus longissimus TaxID=88925 RepID=UPI00315C6042